MFFFTATINSWKHLLEPDEIKLIIIDSLNWLHKNNRAPINWFVLMPNHIHLLWHSKEDYSQANIEFTLLSYTAHQFKTYLKNNNLSVLNPYKATQNDREYHFWERRSWSIEVLSLRIAEQKLDYIHENPCKEKWGLAEQPTDYFYSSARFYE